MCGKEQIFGNVRDAAYHIIAKKQATYYAIGLALVEICEAVLRHENSVLTISSLLNDYLGVSDVYLSVPVIINREGVARLIELELTPEELQAFQGSAQVVRRTITELAVESLSLA